MVTLEEAKSQEINASNQLAQKRATIQEARSNLQQLREQLPEVNSQKMLRTGGQRGRLLRGSITEASNLLDSQNVSISDYEQELTDYENSQLKPIRDEIKDYEDRQNAIEKINKAYGRADGEYSVALIAQYGEGYEKKYAEDFLKQVYAGRSASEVYLNNPDLTQSKIDTLMSKGLSQDLAYAKLGLKLTKVYDETPVQINDIVKNLPRDVKTQTQIPEQPKFSVFQPMFGTVSAQPVSDFNESKGSLSRFGDYAGSKIKRVGEIFLTKFDKNPEIYLPSSGQFISASPTGASATGYLREPTAKEKYMITQASIKGDAIAGIPAQYLGTAFNKQLDENVVNRFNAPSFGGRVVEFLNPVNQYSLAVYNEKLRGGLEDPRKSSNTFQAIAGSGMTPTQRALTAGGVRVVQTVPYFLPVTKNILGVDMLREGVLNYQNAKTIKEKVLAGVNIGVGGLLAFSPLKSSSSGASQVTGTPNQMRWLKGASYSSGLLLGGSIGAIDYFSTYGQTRDIPTSLGAGLGTGGTLAIGSLYPEIKKRVNIRTLEIPLEKSEPIKYNLFGFETEKGRGLVLGYNKGFRFGFGRPDITADLKLMSETGEIPIGSALETNTFLYNFRKAGAGSTPRAKELIPIGQEILRETRKIDSPFINIKELKTPTERLPREGVKLFLGLGRKYKGILFGSKSRAFQLAQEYEIGGKMYKLNKVPRDIELRFDSLNEEGLQRVTDKAVKKLKKLGTIKEDGKLFELGTAREIKDTPYAIEAKINGQYEKVAELKGNIENPEVPEFVIGIEKIGDPLVIGKIRKTTTTKLNEELRGVAQGIFRARYSKEKNLFDIFPVEKREKDIGSFSVSARTLENFNPKLRKNIEKFESFFPEEKVKEQLLPINQEPDKSLIADFSQKSKSSPLKDFFEVIPTVSASPVKEELPSKSFSSSPKSPKSLVISSIRSVLSKSSSSSRSSSPSLSPSLSSSSSSSVSKSFSSSLSPSPSKSISPSLSPSLSPSPSKSPSPSRSPSPSKSSSPSKSPSPSVSPSLSSRIKRLMGNSQGDTFQALGKRFGKDKTLGTFRDEREASSVLKRFLTGSLGRSGKILKDGEAISFDKLQSFKNSMFRPSKRDKNRVVQEARFSLNSLGEKQEIKGSRKKRKKGFSWW